MKITSIKKYVPYVVQPKKNTIQQILRLSGFTGLAKDQ